MTEFFNAISSFIDVIVGFFETMVTYFKIAYNALNYVNNSISAMPSYFETFAIIVISLAIVGLVLNRG